MPLISDSRDKKNQCEDHDREVLKEKPSFSDSLAAHQIHLSLTHMHVHSLFHPFAHSFNSFHHLFTLMHLVSILSRPYCVSSVGPGVENTTHRVDILLGRHDN